MQFLNIATTIAAYTFAAALAAPFVLTAIYAATGVDVAGIRRGAQSENDTVGQSANDYPSCPLIEVPDMLGPELDGDAIFAEIDRVLAKPSPLTPAIAATFSAPSAVLTIPVDTDLSALKVGELRARCTAAGIVWSKAGANGAHMRKADMIAALEA